VPLEAQEPNTYTFEEKFIPGTKANAFRPVRYVISDTGCWECISHKPNAKGYVIIGRGGKFFKLHRYAFEQINGYIVESLEILHLCDNRKCMNPEHLRLGTSQENVADKVSKDRQAKGERSASAKLT
jgi:hypothetical protein